MAELADGFLALPGGFGTIEELSEVLTWGQLGLHDKPVGVLNVSGYFDHFLRIAAHGNPRAITFQVKEGSAGHGCGGQGLLAGCLRSAQTNPPH